MVWVKVDDAAMMHPKQMQAGLAACGLWLAGLCYANKHATDGVLPADLRLVFPSEKNYVLKKLAMRLVKVGLWAVNEAPRTSASAPVVVQSFTVCNYIVFQSQALRDQQSQRRDTEKLRQQRYREKMKGVTDMSRRDKSVVTGMSHHPVPDPDPVPIKTGDPDRQASTVLPSTVRGAVSRFFRDGYEQKRNVPWQQHAMYSREFDAIAKMCASVADVQTGVENYFNLADAYVVKKDYSPTILAKDWNKYRHPPKLVAVADNDSRWHESNRAAWVYDRFDQPPPGCDSARLWWEHHENNRIREAS